MVRLGLNEDCWLGINGVPAAYADINYQRAVIDYVSELTANGMYAIVDLHWTAPGTVPATSLRAMPDEDGEAQVELAYSCLRELFAHIDKCCHG